MPLLNCTFLTFFSLSFRLFRKIKKALPSEKNKPFLNFTLRLTGTMIVNISLATILWGINVWNQGIYDEKTLITYATIYFNTSATLFLIFLVITQLNPNFTLTTKVQADGQVLIVLLNDRGCELAKLYLENADEGVARR